MSSLLEPVGGAGEHLLLRENLSDTSIVCRGFRFPAHSLLLASQSPVLRSMLSGDFSEKGLRRIVLKDVEPETVELFLEYVYCGRAAFETWRGALGLLRMAHRYQVEALVRHCGRFLEGVLEPANACPLYQAGLLYGLRGLRQRALALLLDAGFALLETRAFEDLSKEAVLEVVSSPVLNVQNELTVFRALLRWAPSHLCRLGLPVSERAALAELGPLLGCVCFDDMSDAEKAELPAAAALLRTPARPEAVDAPVRNRVNLHVPESLLAHAARLEFRADRERRAGPAGALLRFSLDAPLHLVAVRLAAALLPGEPPPPGHLCISPGPALSLQSLSSAAWREEEGGEGPGAARRWCEAELVLRQPCRLEPGTAYRLYCTDRTRDAQCPRTVPVDRVLLSEAGRVNLSLHCEEVWGVTGLMFV